MVTTMRAAEVSWRDLSTRFGLQLTEDATFFLEWQAGLPEISDQEKQQLDRVRAGYFNLIYQATILEDAVKMAVLSPLLYLADFFLPPLYIQSEVAMQLHVDAARGKDRVVVRALLLIGSARVSQRFEDVLGESPQLVKVVDTDAHEGPVYVAEEDALYFSTVPRGRETGSPEVEIKRLELGGVEFPLDQDRITVVRTSANAVNGMALGLDGRLARRLATGDRERATHDPGRRARRPRARA